MASSNSEKPGTSWTCHTATSMPCRDLWHALLRSPMASQVRCPHGRICSGTSEQRMAIRECQRPANQWATQSACKMPVPNAAILAGQQHLHVRTLDILQSRTCSGKVEAPAN